MRGYYSGKLEGERLQRCYELASPRIRQYLEAEIRFVLERMQPGGSVLELGCGYGRVALRLLEKAERVVGIDTAEGSIALAKDLAGAGSRCSFQVMDAAALDFEDDSFDAVVCIQNGICAFGVEQEALLREALRVTRHGGQVLFSTYADRFWPERLRWFEAQAGAGLLGPIDYERTCRGTIVCEDGFRSGQVLPERFRSLWATVGMEPTVTEVDGSSLFSEVIVRTGSGRSPGPACNP